MDIPLPKGLRDILDDALQVIENKSARENEAGVRLAAQAGDSEARGVAAKWDIEDGRSPLVLHAHDGSELKRLSDIAIASGISHTEAAHYVAMTPGLDPTLINEAEGFISNPSWGETACIMLIPENPEDIAMEDPENLHLTMVYFPETDLLRMSKDKFFEFVENTSLFPIEASANGITRFYNDEKEHHIVLNIDSTFIEDFRAGLLNRLKMEKIEFTRTHGYTPHMTLTTVKPDEPTPAYKYEPKTVRFIRLRASYGGTVRQYKIQGWDTKGVRRVRSPEGVRKYGQPIGTIIIRDAVPDRVIDTVRTNRTAKSGSIDDLLKGKNGKVEFERNGLKLEAVSDAGLWTGREGVFYKVLDMDRGGRKIKSGRFGTEADLTVAYVDKTLRTALKQAEDSRPAMVKKESSFFRDRVEGIRGLHWSYEDDPENDDSEEMRLQFADMDTEELGLVIENTYSTIYDDLELRLHVDTQEVVNMSMRAYQEMWPDINRVLSKFRVTDENLPFHGRGYYAYNARETPSIRDILTGKEGDESDYMAFNATHFGTHGDGDMGRDLPSQIEDGYKVGNITKIAEDLDISYEQAAMLRTFNHEFGHSIARRLFNERIEPEADDIKQGFFNDLNDLMVSYDRDLDLSDVQAMSARFRGFAGDHVSGYGASSLHELMAEIWASYMLDSDHTEFIAYAGNLMDYWFSEYMIAKGEK